jgi:hypothetical protein
MNGWLFSDLTEWKLLHICGNSLLDITRIEGGNADLCRQREHDEEAHLC